MRFEDWMRELDGICLATFGMSIDDFPDMCFRDGYDDGVEPMDFIHENLAEFGPLVAELLLS